MYSYLLLLLLPLLLLLFRFLDYLSAVTVLADLACPTVGGVTALLLPTDAITGTRAPFRVRAVVV